jgi:3-hydroxymyristoyl/3-hydroxydecanoyl-(acyl carrier protein) dehydratase
MNPVIDLKVPATHPCLPGHFPANPVVPGVVILDLVTEKILGMRPGIRISAIPQVKFLAPLTPETEFQLSWSETPTGQIDFHCDTKDQRLVQGRLQIEMIQ